MMGHVLSLIWQWSLLVYQFRNMKYINLYLFSLIEVQEKWRKMFSNFYWKVGIDLTKMLFTYLFNVFWTWSCLFHLLKYHMRETRIWISHRYLCQVSAWKQCRTSCISALQPKKSFWETEEEKSGFYHIAYHFLSL